MDFMIVVTLLTLFFICIFIALIYKSDNRIKGLETQVELQARTIGETEEKYRDQIAKVQEISEQNISLQHLIDIEVENNKKILSQKKSSEVRLGACVENIIGLMTELPYDPKNLHHMGQPIDYLYFNYDEAEIVFVEVKSGNATESDRQKMIKRAIQAGKVYYERLTINEKGIHVKRGVNLE
jgi:predicted Holliday junction resolvase-like endonuclease